MKHNFLEIGMAYLTWKSVSGVALIQTKALHSDAFNPDEKDNLNIIFKKMKCIQATLLEKSAKTLNYLRNDRL